MLRNKEFLVEFYVACFILILYVHVNLCVSVLARKWGVLGFLASRVLYFI